MFRGYDTHSGCEIAWNVIKVNGMPKTERKRITVEINLIKTLEHPNIIHFIAAWESNLKEEVIFITEIVTGGTLKSYLKRIRHPKLKVIKQWCREILSGLEYLHGQKPNPVVHRDLKCDNIFIMDNTGQIRIADLGLSTTMSRSFATSVVGTPEYMAPEVFDGHYGPKVDIYAFGMCLLEMCTLNPPYRECQNPASVFRKVMAGLKPQALDTLEDIHIRDYISLCLSDLNSRPTAAELLSHPFMVIEDDEDNEPVAIKHMKTEVSPSFSTIHHHRPKVLNLSLILTQQGQKHHIEFEYRVGEDKPEIVARELVNELMLEPSAVYQVSTEIETLVTRKLKSIEPRSIFHDSSREFKVENKVTGIIGNGGAKVPRSLREPDPNFEVASRSSHKSSVDSSFDFTPQSHFHEPDSPFRNGSIYAASGTKSITSDSEGHAEKRHMLPTLTHAMRRGADNNKKSEVETLQSALNEVLGTKAQIDGLFTRKTESLVKQFQESQGLEVDGIVTHDLWDRLMSKDYAVKLEILHV